MKSFRTLHKLAVSPAFLNVHVDFEVCCHTEDLNKVLESGKQEDCESQRNPAQL